MYSLAIPIKQFLIYQSQQECLNDKRRFLSIYADSESDVHVIMTHLGVKDYYLGDVFEALPIFQEETLDISLSTLFTPEKLEGAPFHLHRAYAASTMKGVYKISVAAIRRQRLLALIAD